MQSTPKKMATKLPKPVMKGLWVKSYAYHMKVGAVLTVAAVGLYKAWEEYFFTSRWTAFEKTYDMEKDFQRKMKAGVFQCIDSNGVIRKSDD
ncbi:cytochrome c oxidase subunit 6C-like [Mytilus californianus]|uniref:cytochrome c oxidase subunit 6C-like n=1 Tax=Mytilus californianus TaxID=6549 RepID=UPI0022480B62|nr:cytochrome c oxidase subunit 6C-like [Mytilus californianus]